MFYRVFFPSLLSGLFSALGKEFGMPSAIILPNVISAALGKCFGTQQITYFR